MDASTSNNDLPPREAGIFLGGAGDPVRPSVLAKWRCRGSGPDFIKIGRRVRYSVAALEAWKRAQTRRATRDDA